MNPYKIEPPFCVSFSGGRTSAFMLRMILDAHGGSIPDGGVVCFQNTGMEHPKTLDFIDRVAREWGVAVAWVEYRAEKPNLAVVDYETASRDGEPFAALIKKRNYLPNPVARFCTTDLKIKVMHRYMESLGHADYTSAVGLRADEPRRVHRIRDNPLNADTVCPVHAAGHTREDVLAFWKSQPFDLELPNDDPAFGNCTLCFLKGRERTDRVIQNDPRLAEWWIRMEDMIGGTFRSDRPSYRQMLTQVTVQGRLFDGPEEDTIPCFCTE